MKTLLCTCGLFAALAAAVADDKGKLEWRHEKGNTISGLHRVGAKAPLLVVRQPKDGRPYVHPLASPDGKSALTEDSPAHHKHQTGLFVGFLKVNGRDYFHNRGKDYFRTGTGLLGTGRAFGRSHDQAKGDWVDRHDLLDNAGDTLLHVQQRGYLYDHKDHYYLDLTWTAVAQADVTFGKHDYGGLFLRMPWRQKTGGKATSSEGKENAKAEGQKARWVDVGMPIEGRKDWGRIAILDHKDNFRHPPLWRVDGQLGVGPAISRAGEWKLAEEKSITLKYRLVVYTGDLDKKLIEKAWKDFVGAKK